MDHTDLTASRLEGAANPAVASAGDVEATASTMAPNVGLPFSVDDEVEVRPRDRRSDRDTGFGSLDRLTELRLATPGDFRTSTTTQDSYSAKGIGPTVICEDLRPTHTPKNVTFRGTHRRRRDRDSSSSLSDQSDGSETEGPRPGPPWGRRYGGYRGRASAGPSDTPAGIPKDECSHFDSSRGGGASGGAKPRHSPATPHHFTEVGDARDTEQPGRHSSGGASGGAQPRSALPAEVWEANYDTAQYRHRGCGDVHSNDLANIRNSQSDSRKTRHQDESSRTMTNQDRFDNGGYSHRNRVDRYTERSSRSSRPVLPTLKLGTYNGSTCLRTFLSKFENCSDYYEWSDRERLCHLRASLEGSAGQVLWDAGNCTSADDLIRLLKNRFGSLNEEERYRSELKARRRRRGESLQSVY